MYFSITINSKILEILIWTISNPTTTNQGISQIGPRKQLVAFSNWL